MKKSKFVQVVNITDPGTNGQVSVAMFKHENGGMFGNDNLRLLN